MPWKPALTYASMWSGATPGTYSAVTVSTTLGQNFYINKNGRVVALRYFRDLSDGGRHLAWIAPYASPTAPVRAVGFHLKTAGSQGAGAWETAYFHPYLRVASGTRWSLFTWFQNGRYWRSAGALSGGNLTVGDFVLPQDTSTNYNGAYDQSAGLAPSTRNGGARYGIDLLFLEDF